MYLNENQARHTLVIRNDSLPTPSSAKQLERKETQISSTRQETMTDVIPTVDTLVSQVTPLLGITPCESTQLQSTNTPEDIEEILGTRAFQKVCRYTYTNFGWNSSQSTKAFSSIGPRS